MFRFGNAMLLIKSLRAVSYLSKRPLTVFSLFGITLIVRLKSRLRSGDIVRRGQLVNCAVVRALPTVLLVLVLVLVMYEDERPSRPSCISHKQKRRSLPQLQTSTITDFEVFCMYDD